MGHGIGVGDKNGGGTGGARGAGSAADTQDRGIGWRQAGAPWNYTITTAGFGAPDNEIAVIERLKQTGIDGVGMVYNFSHGHGDIAEFSTIWKRIQRYVMAVNVSGMVADERLIPPSQGDFELTMPADHLQCSGWQGPVGMIAEQGGDAEVTLGNGLRGLDWLNKEIEHPGSSGQRPHFDAAPVKTQ